MMPRLLAAVLLAHLLGSIPFSVLLARIFHWPDPRHNGSGHTGALNTYRSGSPWGAALVLLLDALKGAAAVWLAGLISPNEWAIPLAGMAAIAGHIWPVWFGFKASGMGLASTLGAMLVISPLTLAATVGLAILARVFISHNQRSVIAAALALPPVLFVMPVSPLAFWLGTGIALILALRHIEDWDRTIGIGPTSKRPLREL